MRLNACLMLLTLVTVGTPALAGTSVYRYVDKDGVTHYTDKPPTPDARPVDLPPIQTIGPTVPLSSVAAPSPGAAPSSTVSLSIVSPVADDTLRGDDRRLPVSVRAERLPDGAGLVFLLDGTAQNKTPTQSLSYTIEGVERGSHMVAVSAVDSGGRELGRSPPVIVHMMPPTVNMAPKIGRPR